ncbi:MAG: asparagine synthase-related protein [Candidatus Sulfotelmatobacter sp.]
MVKALLHESFYLSGFWANESLGVYAGWVDRQGSFCDRMPLRNEQGDIVLAFSGEEFPDPGTVQRLKQQGHQFDADGSSYLVHLAEESPSFPAGLNGRFHGLLVDHNRGTAMLFNDRYGMHRIYYHESRDVFYFASEAKGILAVCPELRKMDSRGMGEFVACGAVLENRTLFEGIHVLPPASAWVFRDGSLERKSTYFQPSEWEQQEKLDAESYYSELQEVFTRNLPRYFNGHQRIGMSLTGGLDTRMILASRKPDPGSLPCYTFGSMFRENQDVRVARRVAAACNQPHEVITAGPEFLSQFSHYAERAVYLTDGCVDVGRAPDLYLNEKVRQIAPLRMTGNYGGEILRGVCAFKAAEPTPGLFSAATVSSVRQAKQTLAEAFRCHPVSAAAFKLCPWNLYGILALEQTQLCVRSPFLDNDLVRTVFRSPASALASNQVSLRLIADGNPALLRIPTDRGLAGNCGRVSQTASRGLLEFLFKAEYACDMGMPQWLARCDHALQPLRLERLFLGRHKPFHFRVWYRDALAGYVQDVLFDPRSMARPYLEREGLKAVVRGHLRGNRNYTSEIHKLLTLEMIHRTLLDSPPNVVLGQSIDELPCIDFLLSTRQNCVLESQIKCPPS